jgi:hypothetical protein
MSIVGTLVRARGPQADTDLKKLSAWVQALECKKILGETPKQCEQAIIELINKYPDFPDQIQDFILTSRLAYLKNRLDGNYTDGSGKEFVSWILNKHTGVRWCDA